MTFFRVEYKRAVRKGVSLDLYQLMGFARRYDWPRVYRFLDYMDGHPGYEPDVEDMRAVERMLELSRDKLEEEGLIPEGAGEMLDFTVIMVGD